jgi:hypothetical protein
MPRAGLLCNAFGGCRGITTADSGQGASSCATRIGCTRKYSGFRGFSSPHKICGMLSSHAKSCSGFFATDGKLTRQHKHPASGIPTADGHWRPLCLTALTLTWSRSRADPPGSMRSTSTKRTTHPSKLSRRAARAARALERYPDAGAAVGIQTRCSLTESEIIARVSRQAC